MANWPYGVPAYGEPTMANYCMVKCRIPDRNNVMIPSFISDLPNNRKFLNRFQYVFENDPKAPVYFFGLFKGYLAIDTSRPSHYKVSKSRHFIEFFKLSLFQLIS